MNIPYSLKILRDLIFEDFKVKLPNLKSFILKLFSTDMAT